MTTTRRRPQLGASARRTATATVTSGSALTALYTNSPLAYGLAAVLIGLVVLAALVMLPAVWSRRADRRGSAYQLVRLLLRLPATQHEPELLTDHIDQPQTRDSRGHTAADSEA